MYLYDEDKNDWVDHRKTSEYRKRKSQVKGVWIGLGLFVLLVPSVIALVVLVFSGFMTLSYLDEVPYEQVSLAIDKEDNSGDLS